MKLGELTGSATDYSTLVAKILCLCFVFGFWCNTSLAQRTESQKSLREIAIGLLNHQQAHAVFPHQAIRSKKGKYLLSWRVAILPFIGEDKLYKQFRLDEPWDSDHNKTLLGKMPSCFGSVGGPNTKTVFLAYVNPQANPNEEEYQPKTAFASGRQRPPGMRSFSDGTAKTILVVEADPNSAVEWTKPKDLVFVLNKKIPGIDFKKAAFNVALVNGSTIQIRTNSHPQVLSNLITRSDGYLIPKDEYMVGVPAEKSVVAKNVKLLSGQIDRINQDQFKAVYKNKGVNLTFSPPISNHITGVLDRKLTGGKAVSGKSFSLSAKRSYDLSLTWHEINFSHRQNRSQKVFFMVKGYNPIFDKPFGPRSQEKVNSLSGGGKLRLWEKMIVITIDDLESQQSGILNHKILEDHGIKISFRKGYGNIGFRYWMPDQFELLPVLEGEIRSGYETHQPVFRKGSGQIEWRFDGKAPSVKYILKIVSKFKDVEFKFDVDLEPKPSR